MIGWSVESAGVQAGVGVAMAVAPAEAIVRPLFVGTAFQESLPGSVSLAPKEAARAQHAAPKLNLLDMPSELLEAIMFDTQLNLQDITSLALCCKRLSSHSVSRIRRCRPILCATSDPATQLTVLTTLSVWPCRETTNVGRKSSSQSTAADGSLSQTMLLS